MKNTWRHFVLFLHDAMGGGNKNKNKNKTIVIHIPHIKNGNETNSQRSAI
jgi:hypothetical protein